MAILFKTQMINSFSTFENLTLIPSVQRTNMGRRLYNFKQNDQLYWLKLNLINAAPSAHDGLLNEINIYKQLNIHSAKIALPFESVNIENDLFECAIDKDTAFIVPHAEPLFVQCANQLSIYEIKKILLEAVKCLQQLRTLGWLHGDLKPQHFVKFQGQTCLIDFEQTQSIYTVQQNSMNATPHYMAPELFHGEPKTLQTEFYALGVIFYEWLTQQRLQAKTYQDWAILHCQQFQPIMPSKSSSFEMLLNGLLQKNKYSRFAHFREIIEILE